MQQVVAGHHKALESNSTTLERLCVGLLTDKDKDPRRVQLLHLVRLGILTRTALILPLPRNSTTLVLNLICTSGLRDTSSCAVLLAVR